MTSQYFTWDAAFSTTTIASSAIGNGGSLTTAAISNNSKFATIVSITIVYATGTVNQGAVAYILEDIDGTNYEATTDNPYGVQLNYASGGTYHATIKVLGSMVDNFKVCVTNNSNVSVTATVDYKQCTVSEV